MIVRSSDNLGERARYDCKCSDVGAVRKKKLNLEFLEINDISEARAVGLDTCAHYELVVSNETSTEPVLVVRRVRVLVELLARNTLKTTGSDVSRIEVEQVESWVHCGVGG